MIYEKLEFILENGEALQKINIKYGYNDYVELGAKAFNIYSILKLKEPDNPKLIERTFERLEIYMQTPIPAYANNLD